MYWIMLQEKALNLFKDIKVKALNAAKRFEELKANERKLRKEAAKQETAKIEQKNHKMEEEKLKKLEEDR
ncbi:hypothetical protein AMTR_s00040p00212770 [Amborella trichopoda]|uniref:Uncharacterized protein n=1 Tax=Amborella trichopoda TaxID=13333 RepID=W1PYN8_AMBTC|nr:hypothetical protein AMTR_s00040p00212770 [Amborella trichopoda]